MATVAVLAVGRISARGTAHVTADTLSAHRTRTNVPTSAPRGVGCGHPGCATPRTAGPASGHPTRDRLATLDRAHLRRHAAALLRAHTHEQVAATLNAILGNAAP